MKAPRQRKVEPPRESLRTRIPDPPWTFLLVTSLILLVSTHLVGAQPALTAPATVSVEAGFNGYAVPGTWIPLTVRLETDREGIDGEVIAEVKEGSRANPSVTRYRHPVQVPPGTVVRLAQVVPYPDARWPITVRITAGGTQVEHEVRPRRAEGLLLVLSRDRAGIGPIGGPPGLVVVFAHEDDLPVDPRAYEGVKAFVIHDLSGRRLDEERHQALLIWIARGGRLLISTGERFPRIDLQAFQPALPAVPLDARKLSSVKALSARFGGNFADSLSIAILSPLPGAEITLTEGEVPLIVQKSWGRGKVVMWAFDYLDPSLIQWAGRSSLWKDLLGERPPAQPLFTPALGEILPASIPVPGSVQLAIGLWMMGYIVAVRWLMQRRPATLRLWLEGLLVGVVVFAAGSWFGAEAIRARSTALARVTVIEGEAGTGYAAITSYLRLIAPSGQVNEIVLPKVLTFVRPLPPNSAEIRWRPGEVRVRGKEGGIFEAFGTIALPLNGRAHLRGSELEVEVDNQTSAVLQDFLIVYRGKVQPLPPIPPGRFRWFTGSARWILPDAVQLPEPKADLLQWIFSLLSSDVTIEDEIWLLGWVEPEAFGIDLSMRLPSLWGEQALVALRFSPGNR